MTRAAVLAVAVLVAGVCFGGAPVYEFDGVDDYITVGDTLNMGLADLTLSLWVKTTATATTGLAGKLRANGSTGRYGLLMSSAAAGKCRAIMNYPTTAFIDSTTSINDGSWHHCSVVFDRDADMTLYIDGASEASTSISAGSAANMVIAWDFVSGVFPSSVGTPQDFYAGDIRAVQVNSRALSAAEIRGLYVAGGGRNTFGALSVVLPRANDESVVYTLDAPVLTANLNTGKVLAEDAVIASKDAARNYGLSKGGVTVGSATISTPAP